VWINIRVVFCFKDLCSNSGLIRFCLLLYFYFTQYLFWLALHKKEGEDKKIGKTPPPTPPRNNKTNGFLTELVSRVSFTI